jgi:hypothetical protein
VCRPPINLLHYCKVLRDYCIFWIVIVVHSSLIIMLLLKLLYLILSLNLIFPTINFPTKKSSLKTLSLYYKDYALPAKSFRMLLFPFFLLLNLYPFASQHRYIASLHDKLEIWDWH